MKIGRRRPDDSWTQSWGSSETESLLLPLLIRSSSSDGKPKGQVWWMWAWWRARPNRAPAAYLCIGVNVEDDIVFVPKENKLSSCCFFLWDGGIAFKYQVINEIKKYSVFQFHHWCSLPKLFSSWGLIHVILDTWRKDRAQVMCIFFCFYEVFFLIRNRRYYVMYSDD